MCTIEILKENIVVSYHEWSLSTWVLALDASDAEELSHLLLEEVELCPLLLWRPAVLTEPRRREIVLLSSRPLVTAHIINTPPGNQLRGPHIYRLLYTCMDLIVE